MIHRLHKFQRRTKIQTNKKNCYLGVLLEIVKKRAKMVKDGHHGQQGPGDTNKNTI